MTSSTSSATSSERDDLRDLLGHHRELFRGTVEGLSDDAARSRPTVSELSLGGLIKHVAATEQTWATFIVDGPAEQPDVDWANIDWNDPPAAVLEHQQGFRMLEDETLDGLLSAYAEVASRTDDLIRTVDLDSRQPLPAAPWFEPGASWSARRVLLHIAAETAQHAGHADILRESIDGRKSMG
ncbi:MAG: DinB family protein [Nocardioides sp.]